MNRFSLFWLLLLASCGGINLFSIEDDIALGTQVDQEIESRPDEYPVLDEADFPDAYAYLREIRDEILNTGEVAHADDFGWKVHLIEDDEVLNAFATPGGFLYFYTGLIKYLDTEDAFAGVMAHEIAHGARRHTTESLTEQFGLALLLEAALGGNLEIVQEIAAGLATLSFSREHESEADEFSVIYLAVTRYQCNGAALFFEKLLAEGDASSPPEFLSTHPSPENRVEAINAKAEALGCDTTPSGRDYDAFKAMLP
jgi:predicted Zn-dependent protease